MSFIFSVIALLLGPFVYLLANRREISKQIFDGLIFITIAGIVCVYIIPQSIQIGGILAIIFVAFGLIFPYILENLLKNDAPILFEGLHSTYWSENPKLKDRIKIGKKFSKS